MRRRIVFEIPKPEVSQQGRAQSLSKTCSQTVVVSDGAASQAIQSETDAAKVTERTLAGQLKAGLAITPEHLQRLTGGEVDTRIEAVSDERAGTRRDKVVGDRR